MTIYTQIASMPTIFCAVPKAFPQGATTPVGRGVTDVRGALDREDRLQVAKWKVLRVNDVHFIVDFRQGEVAFDRGKMDGVRQAVPL